MAESNDIEKNNCIRIIEGFLENLRDLDIAIGKCRIDIYKDKRIMTLLEVCSNWEIIGSNINCNHLLKNVRKRLLDLLERNDNTYSKLLKGKYNPSLHNQTPNTVIQHALLQTIKK